MEDERQVSSMEDAHGVGNPAQNEIQAMAVETLAQPCEECRDDGRAEIDTSAPFESVKEAVDRFGGSAVWKSQLKQLFSKKHEVNSGELEVSILEEQTAQLEKDLIIKERETLDVLKELESTKQIIANLKSKIQKEAQPESNPRKIHPCNDPDSPPISQEMKCPNILNELKQAKLNLNKTTSDLASIRSSIEFLNTSIETERALLDKNREKLSENRAIVSSLEKDLNFKTLELKVLTDQKTEEIANKNENEDKSLDISREMQEMNLEIERLKNMTELARSEVTNLTAEIERTKTTINTTEIRFIAAKKIEEAAKESESIALTEIKALLSSNNLQTRDDAVTLSLEEYHILNSKTREVEEASRRKVEEAMFEVEEANRSKLESLERLEKARLEAKESRKVLEEALKRVEMANDEKNSFDQTLRKLRCQKRSSHGFQSTEKFKKVAGRRDYSKVMDDNGSGLDSEDDEGEPTLSIGQILGMKLAGPGLYEYDKRVKRVERVDCDNVSLGQMLSRKYAVAEKNGGSSNKENVVKKRKKFGFVNVGISVLLANKQQRNKKKRPSLG